jgi:hypothetical protein
MVAASMGNWKILNMKITELQAQLEVIKQEHGDLHIMIPNRECDYAPYWWDLETLEVKKLMDDDSGEWMQTVTLDYE